jgi:dienelactone hydrolase
MHLHRLALVAILLAFDAQAAPREIDVTFEGRNLQRSFNFDELYMEGPKLRLTGRFAVPEGPGPFPAVVHLHGCEGAIPPRDEAWVERFTSWGFAVLRLDSLGPRGKKTSVPVCMSSGDIPPFDRAVDAYSAKEWLSQRPEIDPRRIVLAGWSQGGGAVLEALGSPPTAFGARKGTKPFVTGIAFYPVCLSPNEVQAPILILIGDAGTSDLMKPVEHVNLCRQMREHPRIRLEVLPGAHSGFDIPGADHVILGDRVIRHSPQAEATAVDAVKSLIGGLVP